LQGFQHSFRNGIGRLRFVRHFRKRSDGTDERRVAAHVAPILNVLSTSYSRTSASLFLLDCRWIVLKIIDGLRFNCVFAPVVPFATALLLDFFFGCLRCHEPLEAYEHFLRPTQERIIEWCSETSKIPILSSTYSTLQSPPELFWRTQLNTLLPLCRF
jgi:hypothetical protein